MSQPTGMGRVLSTCALQVQTKVTKIECAVLSGISVCEAFIYKTTLQLPEHA